MNNIPTNLSVAAMLPNDPKTWVRTKTLLTSLGANDYLAYIYYKGLRVYCAEEKEIYEWREVTSPGETGGLVPSNYIYPAGLIQNGVDYGNKEYNYFKVLQVEDVVLPVVPIYQVNNVGTGAGIFRNTTNPLTNTFSFNLRRIQLTSVGGGISPIKDIQENADDLNIRLKTYVSDDIIIEEVGDTIRWRLPQSSSLSDFIINQEFPVTYDDWFKANALANGGTPVPGYQYKGQGTMAKPYTDTHVFTLGFPLTAPVITPNTAVQNALDAYTGSGTPIAPQFFGRRLKLQPTVAAHVFTGNLNYNGLKFNVQSGAHLYHSPASTTGENSWLVNLDHSSFTSVTGMGVTIELETDALITTRCNGFKNKGTQLTSSNFAISKMIVIISNGVITNDRAIELGDTPGDFLMFDLNAAGTAGFKNDGNGLIGCYGGKILSRINKLIKGGIHTCDFVDVEFYYGAINSDIDPLVTPFESVTSAYFRMEKCKFYFFGDEGPTQHCFKLGGNDSQFLLIEPLLNGTVEKLVQINAHISNPNLDPIFSMYNGTAKDGIVCTNTLFDVVLTGGRTARWARVYFNNNYIAKGRIDDVKVDMTGGNLIGVVNYIGRPVDFAKQVSIYYPRFGSRAAAVSALMPIGSSFINTNGMPITGPSDPSWKIDVVI